MATSPFPIGFCESLCKIIPLASVSKGKLVNIQARCSESLLSSECGPVSFDAHIGLNASRFSTHTQH